jgi:hypothetical protein
MGGQSECFGGINESLHFLVCNSSPNNIIESLRYRVFRIAVPKLDWSHHRQEIRICKCGMVLCTSQKKVCPYCASLLIRVLDEHIVKSIRNYVTVVNFAMQYS